MKKKGIELGNLDEEVEEGFSSRSDGHLRYSDKGGKDEFRTTEKFAFGEQADQPPEFHEVGALKLKTSDGLTKILKHAPGKHDKTSHGFGNGGHERKNTKKRSISDIVDSSAGDDSTVGGSFFGGRAAKTTVGGAKASKAEMEHLREKVISTYREIRDKKRKF